MTFTEPDDIEEDGNVSGEGPWKFAQPSAQVIQKHYVNARVHELNRDADRHRDRDRRRSLERLRSPDQRADEGKKAQILRASLRYVDKRPSTKGPHNKPQCGRLVFKAKPL